MNQIRVDGPEIHVSRSVSVIYCRARVYQHSVDDTRLAVKQWNIEQIRAGTRETPISRAVLMILWALD